ncbi:MAG: hypothetical protein COW76_19690 [Shewanella sp. CG18_big_fil_WC_8_21_14_2_50_42_11]|uniref:glycosyltransferase family 2 protein n=1 Tax=Shewanella TaxID=22 RepID=UPI000C3F95E3|nr:MULTISPECIES: glycosyltransferase [Shewanella]NCO69855.1 glycosyltransferase family 2 protein [Shewanella vesiculosa]PIP98683.1 MAG: hypothetical protein COW76_19690 [Shewanella sp. CG18_big_fil_WC_8_21_14_2_50_42_11]
MLLSIVVLSYNRPLQVQRILNNLRGVRSSDFNLIIKDDCSPRSIEIKEIVENFKSNLGFELVFHSNSKNLGYDLNLIDSFSIATSDYVFLLSDDDYLNGLELISLLDFLKVNTKKVLFTPYLDGGVVRRSNAKDSFHLNKFSDVIYNSILFSGLIFHRKSVVNLPKDMKFLSNCIYSQVYIASVLVFSEKDFGFSIENLLYLGGDGENFFGKNSSAVNSNILMDRGQIYSDLRYQSFLLRVVEKIATDTSPIVYKSFLKEYRKRMVAYGLRARGYGLERYISFLKHHFESKNLNSFFIPFALFILIFVPAVISEKLYCYLKNRFKKSG